jgi:hypothetical protein
MAAYGQVNYSATDKLELTAALRYIVAMTALLML